MKDNTIQLAVCGRCGRLGWPLTASRSNSDLLLCQDCYARESMGILGISPEEQEKILESMHRYQSNAH